MAEAATRLKGVIVRYGKGGFGFIVSDGAEYFFHQADINPYVAPKEGLTVEFEPREVKGKNDRAYNIRVIAR